MEVADTKTETKQSEIDNDARTEGRKSTFSWWLGKVRLLVLCVLAVVTLYALYTLRHSDWGGVRDFWLARRGLLLQVLLLSCCDIALDGLIWHAVLRQQGIRPGLVQGIILYFSVHAALLMPAQLGRAFRSTEVTRECSASFAAAFSTEVFYLGFTAISALSLFITALAFFYLSFSALFLPLLLIPLGLACTQLLKPLLKKMKLQVEGYNFLQATTLALVFFSLINWMINSLNLFFVFRELIPSLQLHHAFMISTSNLFVSASSGVPGGLGVAESYMGALFYWLEAPPAYLVPAVLAFRLLTVWIWIPVGWLALAVNTVRKGKRAMPDAPTPPLT